MTKEINYCGVLINTLLFIAVVINFNNYIRNYNKLKMKEQEMQSQLITVTPSPSSVKSTASHKLSSIQGAQCSSLFFIIVEIGTSFG